MSSDLVILTQNQDFFVIWIRQLVLLIYISTMFGNWLKKCLISEIK